MSLTAALDARTRGGIIGLIRPAYRLPCRVMCSDLLYELPSAGAELPGTLFTSTARARVCLFRVRVCYVRERRDCQQSLRDPLPRN